MVGVIGLGHMAGIKENWEKNLELEELLKLPEPTDWRWLKWAAIGTVGVLASTVGYLMFG